MTKINCWDFNNCGRESGGNNVDKYGKCHSVMYKSFNGINGGLFGGRYCWHISGTYHDGDPTCIVITKNKSKIDDCKECAFYQQVKREEGASFVH